MKLPVEVLNKGDEDEHYVSRADCAVLKQPEWPWPLLPSQVFTHCFMQIGVKPSASVLIRYVAGELIVRRGQQLISEVAVEFEQGGETPVVGFHCVGDTSEALGRIRPSIFLQGEESRLLMSYLLTVVGSHKEMDWEQVRRLYQIQVFETDFEALTETHGEGYRVSLVPFSRVGESLNFDVSPFSHRVVGSTSD